MYAIYLVHRVNGLCSDALLSETEKKKISSSMEKLRLESFLPSNGQTNRNLNNKLLLALLLEMRRVVDHLSLTKKERSEFPFSLPQFYRKFNKWLQNIQST